MVGTLQFRFLKWPLIICPPSSPQISQSLSSLNWWKPPVFSEWIFQPWLISRGLVAAKYGYKLQPFKHRPFGDTYPNPKHDPSDLYPEISRNIQKYTEISRNIQKYPEISHISIGFSLSQDISVGQGARKPSPPAKPNSRSLTSRDSAVRLKTQGLPMLQS